MAEFFVYDDTANDISFEEVILDNLPPEVIRKLDEISCTPMIDENRTGSNRENC